MAKQGGAIARFLIKWLVIPVGLAAIGFFVVGPRLGEQGRSEALSGSDGPTSPTAEPSKEARITGNPDVTVTSRPVSRRRPNRRRTNRTEEPPVSRKLERAAEPPPLDGEPPERQDG